jgi:hypothetical protein
MKSVCEMLSLAILLWGLLFSGCPTTLKGTDTDSGSVTRLKFTGQNLKVVPGF